MPFVIDENLLFLGLMASTLGIGGYGVLQLLLGLLGGKGDRLEERLSAEVRRELQSTERSYMLRQQQQDLPVLLTEIFFLQQLMTWIRQAFPQMHPVRFLGIVVVSAASAGALGSLRSPVGGILAAIIVLLIAYLMVSMRHLKRQRVLADQLMDALDFLSRVLRAGHSLSTGFQMIADELPEPIASEFRRCHEQISLGHPMDQAMLEMAARVDNTDFAFFVTAVIIQRQTGGDLAALLDNISSVIRGRIRLQQHTKALTAEGRFSGHILTGMPPALFVAMYFINPSYVSVMTSSQTGQIMLVVAATMVILGQLVIRKIVTIKV